MGLDHQQLKLMLTELAGINNFAPFSVHLFDNVPSTNQTLWNLIAQGAKPGTVVIATEQTAGRGQWGHQWFSAVGGLYISVAIAPNLPAEQSYLLTLASAWGIAKALRDRGLPVGIKWLNDLILGERKLGGILTETKIQQGRITKAVVGVGINWANSVPETGINLKSWQAQKCFAPIVSLEMLAAITLVGIAAGHALLQKPDVLIASYQELLINIGHKVSINGNSGVIVGVTSKGELRVHFFEANSTNTREICLKPGTITLGYNSSLI